MTAPNSSWGNNTGGGGNFAWSAPIPGSSGTGTSSLYTAVTNLSNDASPALQFSWWYAGNNGPGTGGAYVDLSTDGGKTWRNIWEDFASSTLFYGSNQVVIPLPQAAGKSQVQIRFRWVNNTTNFGNLGWMLDNVFLGNRSCTPRVNGGLVVGTVTDANTGQGVSGADVTSTASTLESATTLSVPGDPAAGAGFYWMFSRLSGSQQFQATAYRYAAQTATTNVVVNGATTLNFSLGAGQVAVTPSSVSTTLQLGTNTSQKLTLTNTGTSPVSLRIDGQPGGFTPAGQAAQARVPSAASSWTSLPSLPKGVFDNLVVTDPATGDVYSFGNQPGCCRSNAYVYHPGASGWDQLPVMPATLSWPAGSSTGRST